MSKTYAIELSNGQTVNAAERDIGHVVVDQHGHEWRVKHGALGQHWVRMDDPVELVQQTVCHECKLTTAGCKFCSRQPCAMGLPPVPPAPIPNHQYSNAAARDPKNIAGIAEDPKARKAMPVCTGLLDYFPDACADVARLSKVANERHNPGQPMHWSRNISNDHADCIVRHTMDRSKPTMEGRATFFHATMAAWRAMAQLQTLIEEARERGEPYPPPDTPF
jgi:hypothetical protein